MRLGPQVLEAVALFRDGVGLGVLDPAVDLDRTGLDFHALPFALGGHQLPVHGHRTTSGQVQDLALVIFQLTGHHRLQGIKGGAIVHGEKRDAGLGVTLAAQPATNGDLAANSEGA